MLFKLLLLGGLIAAVYYAFFNKKSLPTQHKNNQQPEEAMIPCATCGTYADVKDTLIRDGHYYCSRECMEA
ncbi:MAG TPA: PP0621 family protein [Sulfuricurvum sp.]|nr:PP0621 family protein [Sulfuricurvum sp.]